MSERVVNPTGRGFLLLDSHPAGCFATVARMRAEAGGDAAGPGKGPVALVVGSSAGYGLAATIVGLARHGIRGVGIGFERPAGRRTATAGWYRTIATASMVAEAGGDFTFVNGDAFAEATKAEVLDLIAERFGGVDHLVYSVAAPRRTDPATGVTHQSVIKPLGAAHRTRSMEFDADGTAALREVIAEPASEAEAEATVRVMGGDDWALWIGALAERGLVNDGFRTVALSYIGSALTAAIYRDGSIGAAKAHLEATAAGLTDRLAPWSGQAFTSVNGVAVTQASTAIPGLALYVGLLRAVLGDRMQSPVEQSVQLWEQLTGARPLDLDEQGRIRLDRWELDPAVQAAVTERWEAVTSATIGEHADVEWFRTQFRSLYGFDVPDVDYTEPVETDLPWPT
ncbi:enoyl-[acyl-carrier-protein] reductase FabV [Actinoplanes sp. NPDC049802]|uniref:enoyl-[acyl-carrier-protein] reductase FabV n=1 Tax=Actinoplanes sp. NPDC049802 TaxID=3154742 RepID=UPI0033F229D1